MDFKRKVHMKKEKDISEIFEIEKNGLKLDFEFFTLDYIKKELQKIKSLSIREVKVNPPQTPHDPKRFAELRERNNENKYFTYIKFFESAGELYGIVGGKTNYITPDIDYGCAEEGETRLSRCFLAKNYLKYSHKILVIDHNNCSNAIEDEAQALFIETYVQRLFNLVNS